MRAQVQVENQKQRVIYYENEFAKQKLMLARAIGLPLAQAFELTDQVPYKAFETMPLDDALAQAYARRADYKAALELLKASEARRRSAYGSWPRRCTSPRTTVTSGTPGAPRSARTR